MFKTEIEVN